MPKHAQIIPRLLTHLGNERWRVTIPTDLLSAYNGSRRRLFESEEAAQAFADELMNMRNPLVAAFKSLQSEEQEKLVKSFRLLIPIFRKFEAVLENPKYLESSYAKK